MYLNKINKFRIQKGLTLSELAELCHVSAGYLSHLENGSRKNPSIRVMNKISDALNKSITDVFFE